MLSAFSPKAVVELKPKEKSKIECVLAYGDRLLVGLNNGVLRVYRHTEHESESYTVELLREEERFSKKPIQQLAIIKEAGILVSLSDAYVSFHDLQNYALTERLEKTKGATTFAVISNIVRDATTGIPSIESRLAVAVKRKIFVWSWQEMELDGPPTEMNTQAPVKLLAWNTRTRLIAGMDSGYALIDIESQHLSDIERPVNAAENVGASTVKFGAVNSSGMSYMGMGGWVPKPMATKLNEGQMLLAKDVNTLFIDPDGNTIDKRQVPWAVAPESVGYSYPYLLALQMTNKGTLEIRNPETLSLLQSINLSGAMILHIPQPNISLAHAGKGFLVSSERCIWRMSAVGYASQIDELVEQSLFDEAISLVGLLEDTLLLDKEERLRDIKILKAYTLFEQQEYRDSMALFSEAPAPPEKVIALFPESVSGPISTISRDQCDDGDGKNSASRSGSVRAQNKSKQHRDSDVRSIKSNTSEKGKSMKVSRGIHRLEGRELTLALRELNAFLVQTRGQLQKFLNRDGSLKEVAMNPKEGPDGPTSKPAFEHFIAHSPNENIDWDQKLYDVAVLVDTTLFRSYMLTMPSLAGPLFRLDNFCSSDVVKEKLYSSGRYNDLVDFLHGKRKHEEALNVLETLGKGKEDSTVNEIFQGPYRTIAYLQQLPFELNDLIIQHARWPMEADPEAGMKIFMADTENAEMLPRDRVVHFLMDVNADYALRYLEHAIEDFHDNTVEFHELVIHLYLERLKKGIETLLPGSDVEPVSLHSRLERLLTQSRQYNKNKILAELPVGDPKFFESRAIVLSKLSHHKAALTIYVFEMQNYEKAEEYCNRIHIANKTRETQAKTDPDDPSQAQSIYTSLLSLYLAPPSPHATNLDAALDLLSHHGSRLPALSTLNLLPTAIPVKDLESYFKGRMRAANSLAREHAIVANLKNVEKNRWDAVLAAEKEKRVLLSEDRLCPVCHQRFGRFVIKAWPDGAVTHYGCAERRKEALEKRRTATPKSRG